MKNKMFGNQFFNTFAMAIVFTVLSFGINTQFAYGLDNSRLGLDGRLNDGLNLSLRGNLKNDLRHDLDNLLVDDVHLNANKLDDGSVLDLDAKQNNNLGLKLGIDVNNSVLSLDKNLRSIPVVKVDRILRLDVNNLLDRSLSVHVNKELRDELHIDLDNLPADGSLVGMDHKQDNDVNLKLDTNVDNSVLGSDVKLVRNLRLIPVVKLGKILRLDASTLLARNLPAKELGDELGSGLDDLLADNSILGLSALRQKSLKIMQVDVLHEN